MSFAFRVGEDRWDDVDGTRHRTILSFDEIFDVSAVTYPAYPDTDVALRAALSVEGIHSETPDLAILKEYGRVLRFLIAYPNHTGEAKALPEDCPQGRKLNQLKRRLRILELENSI